VKVLVTGATGFLGGHLVEKLLSEGYEVRALARRTSNVARLRELGVEIVFGDLTEPETLGPATKGVDAVVHLAAYYTFFGKKELYELVNVKGTQWLAEAALNNGVTRFVYCSSTEAIGPVKNPPGDENSPLNPQFEYGRSKARAEGVVKNLAARGLRYTIVRPTGIYGPRNVDDVAYWFITSYAKGGLASRVKIGTGENLIQFAHVADVVQGFLLVLEKEDVAVNQTYIVSEDGWYTYNQVYQILRELTGKGPPSVKLPPLLAKMLLAPLELYDRVTGEGNLMHRIALVDAVTSDRAYSVAKAKRELGYRPRYDLKTGLKEAIEWYRQNGYLG
jgi:nucleoside-diphosphate-sugar epimerase